MGGFIGGRRTAGIVDGSEEVNIHLRGTKSCWPLKQSRCFEGGVRCILTLLPRSGWKYLSKGVCSFSFAVSIYANGLQDAGLERLEKWHCYFFIFEKTLTNAHQKHHCLFILIFDSDIPLLCDTQGTGGGRRREPLKGFVSATEFSLYLGLSRPILLSQADMHIYSLIFHPPSLNEAFLPLINY